MASEILFSGDTRTAEASFKVGCLAGLALTIAVLGGVSAIFLWSGQSMTPSLAASVRVAAPVGIVLAVVLGWWAFRAHAGSARQLTIRRGASAGELALEIPPDVSFQGRLSCDHGWQAGMQHGAARTKLLWCDVMCEGKLMLRLSHEIGGLHPVPPDWPRAEARMDRAAKYGGFTTSKLPRIVALLDAATSPSDA